MNTNSFSSSQWHISIFRTLGIALLLMLGNSIVSAQTSNTDGNTPAALKPGAPAGAYSLSGFENVNLYNGNLNFSLPLLKVGGRGSAGYTVFLAVEQKWRVETWAEVLPGEGPRYTPVGTWWSNLTPGYGPGVLEGRRGGYEDYPFEHYCGSQGTSFYNQMLTRLTFTGADGTEFELRDQLTNGESKYLSSVPCENPGSSRGTIFTTADGTAATFISDTPIFDHKFKPLGLNAKFRPSGYLMLRDGTRYRIDDGLVTWLRDRNGNRLSFLYDGSSRVTKVTDSLNREVTFTYSSANGFAYDEIKYKGFAGELRTIKVWKASLSSVLRSGFTTQTYQQLFPGFTGATSSTFNPQKVSAVELPNDSAELTNERSYRLRYNSYGELARVELPTGGAFEYDWIDGNSLLNEGIIYRRVSERRVYPNGSTLENRTTFSNPVYPSGPVEVKSFDSAGAWKSYSAHYFSEHALDSLSSPWNTPVSYSSLLAGREFQVDSFDIINNSAILRRRVTHTWDLRTSFPWAGVDPRLLVTTTTLVDANLVSEQVFGYDDSVPYNNQNSVKEYDFGSGAPGALVRETRTKFVTTSDYTDAVTGAHLRSLVKEISVFSNHSGTDVERARTVIEFDNYTTVTNHAELVERPGISGFDPAFTTTYTKRGNATATTRYFLNSSGDPTGSISSFQQYDMAGNVVRAIDGRGHATDITYADCFGAPDGNATLNSAPAELSSVSQTSFAFATTIVNAAGHVVNAQVDYYLGQPVDAKDANGVVMSGIYDDDLDRPTRIIRAHGIAALQNQTTFSYDDVNHTTTTVSDLNSNGDGVLVSKVLYDGLGRTTESQQFEGGSNYIATRTQYDALGRAFKTSNPFRQSETPVWTTAAFDALGRVTSVTTPDGAVVSTSYSGNTVTVIDQAGLKRRSVTDGLGRLIRVDEPDLNNNLDSGGVPVQSTYYVYDTLDNLTTVNQGSQTRTFVYDSLKRLTGATNPESGTIEYEYDENANLTKRIDSRLLPNTSTRIATTFVYDNLNRVTSRNYNDTTPGVTYTYDNTNVLNSKGRLTAVTSSVSSYAYGEYDALGRIKTGTQTTDGQAYALSYEYDLAGNMISQTYPSGRKVKANYDDAGRIAGIKNDATGAYYAGAPSADIPNRIQYSASGAVQVMKLGNGLWEHTNFNSRLQATQIGLGSASTNSSILQLDYDYGSTSNNGNVLTQTITVPAVGSAPAFTATQTYTYDSLNRLSTAQENGGTSWKQNFEYDRYGNRKFIAGTTLPAALTPANNPTINANNNRIDNSIAGQTNVVYDDVGNLTREVGNLTYEYDAENKMVRFDGGATTVGGASYSYDGNGQRVKKVVGGTQITTTVFVYDVGGRLIAEYASSGSTGDGTSYVTSDMLGSARVITGTNQQIKGRHDYLPFGEEIFAGTGARTSQHNYSADNLRQKFTSKERDVETGLDYFGARYYSGVQGRFTSTDAMPIKIRHLQNPQTLNRYVYCKNNPLIYIDPTGLEPVVIVVRTYIPYEKVTHPPGVGVTVKGDFNAKGERVSHRTEQKITIETDGNSKDAKKFDYSKNVGESVRVSRGLGSVFGSDRGTSSGETLKADSERVNNNTVRVTARGNEATPLLGWYTGDPGITYNLNITVSSEGEKGNLIVSVSGQHDGFPAYEIEVTRPSSGGTSTIVYRHDPRRSGDGEQSLYGSGEYNPRNVRTVIEPKSKP